MIQYLDEHECRALITTALSRFNDVLNILSNVQLDITISTRVFGFDDDLVLLAGLEHFVGQEEDLIFLTPAPNIFLSLGFFPWMASRDLYVLRHAFELPVYSFIEASGRGKCFNLHEREKVRGLYGKKVTMFFDVTLWCPEDLLHVANFVRDLQFEKCTVFLRGSAIWSVNEFLTHHPRIFTIFFDVSRTAIANLTSLELSQLLEEMGRGLHAWRVVKGVGSEEDKEYCLDTVQRRKDDLLKAAREFRDFSTPSDLNFIRKVYEEDFKSNAESQKLGLLSEYLEGIKGHDCTLTMKELVRGVIPEGTLRPLVCNSPAYYDRFYTYRGMFHELSIPPDFNGKNSSRYLASSFNLAAGSKKWPLDAQDRIFSIKGLIELFLLKIAATQKECSWLDLGCGNGTVMRMINPSLLGIQECKFVGVDVGQGEIAAARTEAGSHCTFIDKSVFDFLDSSATPFQLVTLFEFLEHLFDPLDFLEKIVPIASGYLIVGVPLGQIATPYYSVNHLWSFRREGLEALLRCAGFKVVISKESYVGLHNDGIGHNWLTVVAITKQHERVF